MFNITADALKWLFDRMHPRWLWGGLIGLAALFSVWSSIPEKYQTQLLDYAVREISGPGEEIDLEVASFGIEGAEDEFLVWLKTKIERNLVELFVDNGRRTAHRLAAIKPDSSPHRKIEGTLSAVDAGTVEVSARMLDESGRVVASTSFSAPREFLKANYKALPETLVYGLDVGVQSLKPLATKARLTKSLPAYALFVQARSEAARQNLDGALGLLDQAIAIDPAFATAHRGAGELLRAKGDEAAAKAREAEADRINLDHPKVPLLAGVAQPLPDSLATIAAKSWTEAAPGLAMKDAEVASYGVRILAWKFDPALYHLAVATQLTDQGSTARQIRENRHAILAVNGGFFDIDRSSRLSPSGGVVSEGRKVSPYRDGAGSGVLYEKAGSVGIGWSKDWASLGEVTNAMQAGPMVVDPGGKNGIFKNDFNRHNRTAVCVTGDSQVVVAVATGGLSLFELGAILSAAERDGGFACERAINMDGGPSTQASFRSPDGKVSREVEATWPSQNALILTKRAQ